MIERHVRDWLLLLLCNLIWATQFALVKVAQGQFGPLFTTFFPLALATLGLIPLVVCQKRPTRGTPVSRWSDVGRFALLGLLGQLASQLAITWAMRYSPTSDAAILSLALPVVTAIMARLLLGESMTRVRWFSFAIAIVGVLECLGIGFRSLTAAGSTSLLGDMLILTSVAGSAFYNTYGKTLLSRYTPEAVLLYSYIALLIALLPFTLHAEPDCLRMLTHIALPVLCAMAGLALLVYGLSMIVFLQVLGRLDALQAGLSNYLIPFFGALIGAFFLHERFTLSMIVGGTIVLASTLLVTVVDAPTVVAPEVAFLATDRKNED